MNRTFKLAGPIMILGVELAKRERQIDLGRPFMARFGDIARASNQVAATCG